MNASEVKALETLLQQAMDSAVIENSYGGSPIATAAYLALLTSHRQSYDPDRRMLAARYKPKIDDNSVRKRLLNVIRATLRQYIHNDRLQSAIIVTGGFLEGFKISDLMSHLITIAFCRGAPHAARSFYECVENNSVDMQFITLIDGIKIERDMEISEGIRLVPIPNSASDFPPYIITPTIFGSYADYYGRTLIILDERVSPIFAHPSEMENGRGPFTRSNLNTVYLDYNVAEFCEALSLSINHVVNYVAWWTHFNQDEAYAVALTGRYPASNPSLFHRKSGDSAMEVTDEDIQNAMTLYSTRKDLESDVTQRLRVPIDRWMKSKMDANTADVFINLGTALESLYLQETGSELGFRMALRAAWRLGSGMMDRTSLFNDFKKIYARRSKAVHTGVLTQSEPEFMAEAQKLCLRSIVKIIEDGEFPNWNQLVMGG